MEHDGYLARVVKLAQQTGERVVVSLDAESEPVVILSLSAFEHLIAPHHARTLHAASPLSPIASTDVASGKALPDVTSLPPTPHPASRERRGHTPHPTPHTLPPTPPSNPTLGNTDPADAWDSEYDAERIFAQFTAGSLASSQKPLPERMQNSLSEASVVMRTLEPARGLQGEERFSLGTG